jgi:3-phenylpropionate/trans-cinnamate dioxygenase ferredoxin component
MLSFVKVATCDELPEGGRKVVEVDGRPVALFHLEGTYHAIDDLCTHDGGPLADGELIDCEIQCPRHGARFDLKTGRPLCMPAIEPVTVHAVELRGDDIYVAVRD